MSKFNGEGGRKPQTEARRWVYAVIASILDNGQERGEQEEEQMVIPWYIRLWARVSRWRIYLFGSWPDWSAWHYFSLGGVGLVLYTPFSPTGLYMKPWNAFRRHMNDGTAQWGIGVVQMGRRHLLYQSWYRDKDGRASWGTCVGFIWVIGHPDR